MNHLKQYSVQAKNASMITRNLSNELKNQVLYDFVEQLSMNAQNILNENKKDLENAPFFFSYYDWPFDLK